ncbi:DUF2716 domain-containing protein [Micromonospora sp. HNM0581]|uniref:DUF2716 domain-containing protein n=1 Tax=Micromonospora sp. HNM0581 TaxID=2716341 RepID=UPI001F0D3594|nr:DUF2716 domain-containing protein [Micromonospora sp. HNM0581]
MSGDEAAVWDRFYATFDFRPSIDRFPAITEPTPSVTWSLSGLDDDLGYTRLDRMTEVVHAGLTGGVRRLTEHGIGVRPLLFLDVDGTLLPFAGVAWQMNDEANPLLAGLSLAHGRRLAR